MSEPTSIGTFPELAMVTEKENQNCSNLNE
jgi:hypothetical protein